MIIGDKDKFAVQVGGENSEKPQYYDQFALWCGGQSIGEDSVDILNMYANPLLRAYHNRQRLAPPNDLYLDPDAFFLQDIDWSGEYYDYKIPRLALFDEFDICLFHKNGYFHYLWRISSYFDNVSEEVLGYPKRAFLYTIPEDEFLAVALKVKEVIDRIEGPRKGMIGN